MTKQTKSAQALKSRSGSDLSYISFMEGNLAKDPPIRKGDRTRVRLRIACARLLEQRGYHTMRVADITEEAGVAEGLFYTYFKDKLEITLQVLTTMLGMSFPSSRWNSSPQPGIPATICMMRSSGPM
jgi:hypothetical protein